MIRGVHHVAVATDDLDGLASWYVDVLGFEQVMQTSWENRPLVDRMIGLDRSAARQVMLRAGNAHIEMFEYSAPVPTESRTDATTRQPYHRGYTHFCLDVVDIDAEYERLSAAGMQFHSSPPTIDEMGHARLRAIYGRDPDGNIIELQEVLDATLPFALEQAPLIAASPVTAHDDTNRRDST